MPRRRSPLAAKAREALMMIRTLFGVVGRINSDAEAQELLSQGLD